MTSHVSANVTTWMSCHGVINTINTAFVTIYTGTTFITQLIELLFLIKSLGVPYFRFVCKKKHSLWHTWKIKKTVMSRKTQHLEVQWSFILWCNNSFSVYNTIDIYLSLLDDQFYEQLHRNCSERSILFLNNSMYDGDLNFMWEQTK